MDEERYVVIESGGSLGVIDERGRNHLGCFTVFDDKEEAKKRTRELKNIWGGGYYDYHYSTKTLAWAKKNLKDSELENLKYGMEFR